MNRRWTVNISPPERAGRVLVGVVAAAAGIFMLASAVTVWAGVLEILLVLTGLDLIVTGTLGHCPLYAKLGHLPRSVSRPL